MAENNCQDAENNTEECSTDNSNSPDPCVQPSEVTDWLNSFNFSTYTTNFLENGYDSLFVCSHLEESDLDLLRITKPGHRKTILLKSKELAEHRHKIEAAKKKKEKFKFAKANRQLNDSYWERTKPRKEPYDTKLPVLDISSNTSSHGLRVFLVRHGQSLANEDPSYYTKMADHAVPLSDHGCQQAADAGKNLLSVFKNIYGTEKPKNHYCRLWTSPYLRARETGELICQETQGWIDDSREHMFLGEQQFGLFEGVDWDSDEITESYPKELEYYQKCAAFGGKFWAKIPLGESRFDVCLRVSQAFGSFHRDAAMHGIKNIVIVSHGITIRAFLTMWLHLTPEWFEEEPNPANCSIRLIENNVDKGFVYVPKRPGLSASDTDLLLTKNTEREQP
jgi:2,3-bisphosphoglycerate-dependent phosphoglycerate mutase